MHTVTWLSAMGGLLGVCVCCASCGPPNGSSGGDGTTSGDAGGALVDDGAVPPGEDGSSAVLDDASGAVDSTGVCPSFVNATGCAMQVCANPSECSGSGLTSLNYACDEDTASMAGYVSATNTTIWHIANCAAATSVGLPNWIVMFSGVPTVGTYTVASPGGNAAGVICLSDDQGSDWVAGNASAAVGGDVVGSYSLTFTSVTLQPGQKAGAAIAGYTVHGSFHAVCAPSPLTTPPAPGTVVVDGTF